VPVVNVWVAVVSWPWESTAVQVTVVVPRGSEVGALLVRVTGPPKQMSSTSGVWIVGALQEGD
jgi:hypothetical protein